MLTRMRLYIKASKGYYSYDSYLSFPRPFRFLIIIWYTNISTLYNYDTIDTIRCTAYRIDSAIRLYEQEFSKRVRKSYWTRIFKDSSVRMSSSDNMSETGQLGHIGHSWAALKKMNPFYMILSFEKTSSHLAKKSL